MSESATQDNQLRPSLQVASIVAAIYFLMHMLTATHYGYFRDALYYLACSEHLAWGYVDQPPLIALLGWITRHTIGTSLPALLFWPALAGAGRIVLTAAFARELGARKFGMALAAVLAATPGIWFAIDHEFAMNALEVLFWTGCAFVVVRMINTGNLRLWLAFGAIAGLGLENKYSIAVFAMALVAGLLLTAQRKLLFTPWLLAGGGIALLIFLPNLLWNIHHHWPFLELMHNIRVSGRDVVVPPLAFIGQQILLMSPANFPFWFGGLVYYFVARDAKPYRVFGWTFLITIGFFMAAHGKNYYSAPAYSIVLAAGAVAAQKLLYAKKLAAGSLIPAVLRPGVFVWIIAGMLPLLPLVLPVLPIDTFLKYQERLPIGVPHTEHSHEGAALPQHYADEFGWPEMVATVASVYNSLSPEERAKTAIYTENYGQAAAIDFFGGQYGLPKAICPHQNYFLWGPRQYTGEIMILVGAGSSETAAESFASVRTAALLNNPHGLFYERRPILLCRGLKQNLQTLWPSLKRWD